MNSDVTRNIYIKVFFFPWENLDHVTIYNKKNLTK